MATLVSQDEGQPASWPAVSAFPRPAPIGDPDHPEASVNLALAWQRVEAWIAHRWTPRTVVWTVEGPGHWAPRLSPFTLSTSEIWDGEAWVATTLAPAPAGFLLDAETYRIGGTVGADAGAVPEAVAEAVRRLMEFNLEIAESYKGETAIYRGDDWQAPAGWAAKAIHLCGAADLLRPWRRLA